MIAIKYNILAMLSVKPMLCDTAAMSTTPKPPSITSNPAIEVSHIHKRFMHRQNKATTIAFLGLLIIMVLMET